jgi:hypothetical protein
MMAFLDAGQSRRSRCTASRRRATTPRPCSTPCSTPRPKSRRRASSGAPAADVRPGRVLVQDVLTVTGWCWSARARRSPTPGHPPAQLRRLGRPRRARPRHRRRLTPPPPSLPVRGRSRGVSCVGGVPRKSGAAGVDHAASRPWTATPPRARARVWRAPGVVGRQRASTSSRSPIPSGRRSAQLRARIRRPFTSGAVPARRSRATTALAVDVQDDVPPADHHAVELHVRVAALAPDEVSLSPPFAQEAMPADTVNTNPRPPTTHATPAPPSRKSPAPHPGGSKPPPCAHPLPGPSRPRAPQPPARAALPPGAGRPPGLQPPRSLLPGPAPRHGRTSAHPPARPAPRGGPPLLPSFRSSISPRPQPRPLPFPTLPPEIGENGLMTPPHHQPPFCSSLWGGFVLSPRGRFGSGGWPSVI